ncbi:calcium-binding protein [Qipengyuania sphaerica]|uniref:calcium-binding protein n=1 Tax=Qipengyuania sphaerica TaxID=2867243 RepID=UPI001C88F37E|nr:hypothetical protein [Qipengyuania sphaerica]MBX7542092.1 hypothetical protein [Qipengyuania sphaerica]
MEIAGTDNGENIYGTSGDDTIDALGGNDRIYGSIGTDTIDGGDGLDQLYFTNWLSDLFPMPAGPVTYTLGANSLTSSDGSIDTSFTNIEAVRFYLDRDLVYDVTVDASAFESPVPNGFTVFFLGLGDDVFFGSNYNDTVSLGAGENYMDGAGGFDIAALESATSGEWVYAIGDSQEFTVLQGNNTLLTATNVEMVEIFSDYRYGNVPSHGMQVDASELDGVEVYFINTELGDVLIGSTSGDHFALSAWNQSPYGTFEDHVWGMGGADLYDFSQGQFVGVWIHDFDHDDTVSFYHPYIEGLISNGSMHYGALTGEVGDMAYSWHDGYTEIAYDANGNGSADQVLILAGGYYHLDLATELQDGVTVLGHLVFGSADRETVLTSDADTYFSGTGNETISALGGADLIYGNLGNDFIDGGSGKDTVSYKGATEGVFVRLSLSGVQQDTLGAGIDTLVSIENLTGTQFRDRLEGDATGNRLEGLGGDDRVYGHGGNDVIVLDTGNDRAWAGADDDRIYGQDGNDRIYGDNGDDRLYGQADDDTLIGGAGNDEMVGGTGNDIYFVDDAGDSVLELAGEGNDGVIAGLDYVLGDNVEILRMRTGDFDGTGNGLDNIVRGVGGVNVLHGMGGDDSIYGGTGNDTLDGGDGNDRLYGENGSDTMTGGAGADSFIFMSAEEMGARLAIADIITDFSQSDGDRINLRNVDASIYVEGDQNFAFIGTSAFSQTAGELRYFQTSTSTIVEMDVDGDGVGDLYIRLDGQMDLSAGDFIL